MSQPPPIHPWADASALGWRSRLRRWQYTLIPPEDPWARVATPVDWPGLVAAAPADWRAYFSGASGTSIDSVNALCDWLSACHYCPDQVRGEGRDFWVHPLAFEANRIGDCEDHALWAWRKLVELGLVTEFVLGLLEPTSHDLAVNHAWVHLHDGRQWWLLETTAPRDRMLLTLDAARPAYLPTAAIDHQFESHGFANFYHFRAKGRSMPLPAPFASIQKP